MDTIPETTPDRITVLPRPAIRQWGGVRELIETLMLILAIYALVNLVTVRYFVDGPSMQPNFHTGQFVMVSRIHYLFSDPQRGDIVVFHRPDTNEDLIKRVIGVPGDHIEIRDRRVYINGVALEEPYINENFTTCREYCDVTLGPNEYFVMGDNRNHSVDSRGFGIVTRQHIVGEALLRYWPPSDWGIINRIAYPEP